MEWQMLFNFFCYFSQNHINTIERAVFCFYFKSIYFSRLATCNAWLKGGLCISSDNSKFVKDREKKKMFGNKSSVMMDTRFNQQDCK